MKVRFHIGDVDVFYDAAALRSGKLLSVGPPGQCLCKQTNFFPDAPTEIVCHNCGHKYRGELVAGKE